MKPPFSYFGGKQTMGPRIVEMMPPHDCYVEPFFGSGAILLARPEDHVGRIETINDIDGYVANFWRAVKADPEAVAVAADNPVNELDLTARHLWLVNEGRARIARRTAPRTAPRRRRQPHASRAPPPT